MDVLVVESPAKAKTIGKYLGPGYTVLASYGKDARGLVREAMTAYLHTERQQAVAQQMNG